MQTNYPIKSFDIYHDQIRINHFQAGTTLALQRASKN
jgi:hypothetical protein